MVSFVSRLPNSTGVRPVWHGHIPSNGKDDYRHGGVSPQNEREMQLVRQADTKRAEARLAMSRVPSIRLSSLPAKFQRRILLGIGWQNRGEL